MFTVSPTHNPNIITQLPASKFTHQSPDKCLGAHHINSYSTQWPQTHTHTWHALYTQTLHTHICTVINLTKHVLTHTHTRILCAHIHTHSHSVSLALSYFVPCLIANPPNLGFVTLNFNSQACFCCYAFGIYSWIQL